MSLGIRKGDMVMVISGRDKDEVGRVLAVLPKKGKALVQGVNMVTRHTKPQAKRQGGLVHKEAAMPLCKLMLVDSKTGIASRRKTEIDEKGNKLRRSIKSGNEL